MILTRDSMIIIITASHIISATHLDLLICCSGQCTAWDMKVVLHPLWQICTLLRCWLPGWCSWAHTHFYAYYVHMYEQVYTHERILPPSWPPKWTTNATNVKRSGWACLENILYQNRSRLPACQLPYRQSPEIQISLETLETSTAKLRCLQIHSFTHLATFFTIVYWCKS